MNDTDRAYLAGFMDADGSIRIIRNKPQRSGWSESYAIHIVACSTVRVTLEWINEEYNGVIYKQVPNRQGRGRKDYYVFHLAPHERKRFLNDILPYLHTKFEDARLVLEFIELMTGRGNRHDGTHEQKARLYLLQSA